MTHQLELLQGFCLECVLSEYCGFFIVLMVYEERTL